jgi:hypothetical protein
MKRKQAKGAPDDEARNQLDFIIRRTVPTPVRPMCAVRSTFSDLSSSENLEKI